MGSNHLILLSCFLLLFTQQSSYTIKTFLQMVIIIHVSCRSRVQIGRIVVVVVVGRYFALSILALSMHSNGPHPHPYPTHYTVLSTLSLLYPHSNKNLASCKMRRIPVKLPYCNSIFSCLHADTNCWQPITDIWRKIVMFSC